MVVLLNGTELEVETDGYNPNKCMFPILDECARVKGSPYLFVKCKSLLDEIPRDMCWDYGSYMTKMSTSDADIIEEVLLDEEKDEVYVRFAELIVPSTAEGLMIWEPNSSSNGLRSDDTHEDFIDGKIFCITGVAPYTDLCPREKLENVIRSYGGFTSKNMKKAVHVLLVGENPGKRKIEFAKSHFITIMTIEDLVENYIPEIIK